MPDGDAMSDLTGTWSNQYGSRLELADANGRLTGTFQTGLGDSGFFGRQYQVVGVHCGDCVSFVFAGPTSNGDAVCSFTGLERNGKLQTVWHVASDRAANGKEKRAWPHAVMTNADTFTRD
jgi:Avidin family